MTCSVHNRPLLALGTREVCPACLAEGSQASVEFMRDAQARGAEAALRRRMRQASIPPGFENATFDSFMPDGAGAAQLVSVLRLYCANFGAQRRVRPGFLFLGKPDTGKTHLACAMVSEIVRAGFSAAYASLPRFTKQQRAAFGRAGEGDALIDALVDVDFLVLDEIDLHGSSDGDYNTLYYILNTRHERRCRPTLAISNRSIERLTLDLDERIMRRVLGETKPVNFDWPGRRGAAAGRARQ